MHLSTFIRQKVMIQQRGLVHLNNQEISYILSRNPLRKSLSLHITPTGEIEVRAPWMIGKRRAEAFIVAHAEWLIAKRSAILQVTQSRPLLTDGFCLPLLDSVLTLRIVGEELTRLRRVGNELHLPPPLTPAGLELMLTRWYRGEAIKYLPVRLQWHAERMGITYQKVTIRGQKRRWGSCSSQGRINLNWHLMLLPTSQIDYVMIHELCHRVHMNHSPAFWALVEVHLPEYQLIKKQLQPIQTPWRI